MLIQSWADLLIASFQQVWVRFIGFVPQFLGAVVVFVVGLIVAAGLAAVIEKLVGMLKIDKILAKVGIEEYVNRAGLKLNFGRFLGKVVYWFVVIASLLASSELLGFSVLSSFLMKVLFYIPQVLVGVLIMLVTVIVANFLRKAVKASVMSAKLHAANLLGTITWYAVIIFGLAATLDQIGLDVAIVNTLITGIIAMLALAGGLAFGLGGREYASHLIEKFRGQVENR